jgi:hypothetical protein
MFDESRDARLTDTSVLAGAMGGAIHDEQLTSSDVAQSGGKPA